MISFFNEDTKEEEKLLQEILEKKNDKIPNILKEIVTSHLSRGDTQKKEASLSIKNEEVYYDKRQYEYKECDRDNIKENIKYTSNNIYDSKDCNTALNYSNEELLNVKVDTNIFSFHIKKNGKINSDIFFIPYNSIDDEDVITEYTYSYNYYDIYPVNIEQVNKSFHSNKKRKIIKNKNINTNNQLLIKKEINEDNNDINNEKNEDNNDINNEKNENYNDINNEKNEDNNDINNEKNEDNNNINNEKNENYNDIKNKRSNFQKLLVHFRGRLFIGCHINYSYFKIKTFLAMIKNNENIDDTENLPLFNYVNKNIQTYNLIENATYWKQDEYPDYTDQNIQKLFFFLILIPLNNYNEEESELNYDVVF
ncbi:ribonuclease H2 subunit C, putative [Plasmodium reichenowi]|uniref:Ribonuclease H2 subunit C, putative n=1 Tax=Plasmodium reichenowi TaxID=5854 RepID=A0A060RSI7_PLARE|nr:ribonuclease H2 subunit C, putative [Plasmodium reichenowi]